MRSPPLTPPGIRSTYRGGSLKFVMQYIFWLGYKSQLIEPDIWHSFGGQTVKLPCATNSCYKHLLPMPAMQLHLVAARNLPAAWRLHCLIRKQRRRRRSHSSSRCKCHVPCAIQKHVTQPVRKLLTSWITLANGTPRLRWVIPRSLSFARFRLLGAMPKRPSNKRR